MKRFYNQVSLAQEDGGHCVLLDARRIKTAAGRPQIVPTRTMAQALAEEWSAQGEELDNSLFRLRDLADYAIDIVRPDPAATIAKLLAFIETDTLCYRADPEDALYRRQQEIWEPLLTAFEAREDIKLERVCGIIHRTQASETSAKLFARLEVMDDFTLAGLQTLTSLSTSLCVGLSALENDADPSRLWQAANLEENWQAELWGKDDEAQANLTRRHQDFQTGYDFLQLVNA